MVTARVHHREFIWALGVVAAVWVLFMHISADGTETVHVTLLMRTLASFRYPEQRSVTF